MQRLHRIGLLLLCAPLALSSCAALKQIADRPVEKTAVFVFDVDAGGFQCGLNGAPCPNSSNGFVPYDKAPALLCRPAEALP